MIFQRPSTVKKSFAPRLPNYNSSMKSRPRVALLIETSNAYARDLLQGVRSYLSEHQSWSIYLGEYGRGEILPAWLRGWRGDGIIARVENQHIADELLRVGVPVVDVSVGLQRSPFPRVATDNQAVSRLAAEHLMERGLRHFGYCGAAQYHWSVLRSCFFSDHIRQAGFECSIFDGAASAKKPDSWEQEIDKITAWLNKLPKPVGVLACYDIRGQQVLEACRRGDLQVPDEVAVIGIHNDELLCDLCDPPLTSVIPNARRAGYESAALLARMMAGEKFSRQVVLLDPVGIAIRQSTDVVALDDPRISQAMRYIREHACERITVEDILRAIPMSRTVFERRFKQVLNCTPHEHILRARINHVKTLLTTTDLTLAVIAERTGFEHSEYLSVAFKRAAGVSPGVFRKRSRV